jgi:nucleoside-diphosphate-sugar epimerase
MSIVEIKNNICLVTGAAGFIGYYLSRRLLAEGVAVVGIDNMNDYYDVTLKEERLRLLKESAESEGADFAFIEGDISDKALIDRIFDHYRPDIVINLAAQAGVRYSISHPDSYIKSNLIGFYNILEACRHSYDACGESAKNIQDKVTGQDTASFEQLPELRKAISRADYHGVKHLVYASSSSVYGQNAKIPFSTDDRVDEPVSLYAATKKSNELMAHAYSKLYNIPSTGLRFFTVYGPMGRPDMAYFGFTEKLLRDETIKIFNYGNCERDFTYVDDIVEGIVRVMKKAPDKKNGADGLPVPPYAVYNIGGGRPVNLLEFVDILQQELVAAGVLPEDFDFESHRELVPMQAGDVPVTYADTTALERDFGYRPGIDLRTGLREFAVWYSKRISRKNS